MLPLRTLITVIFTALLSLGCVGGGGSGSSLGSGTSSTPAPLPTGTATVEISWNAPTTRSDGSCLGSDLGSFVVSYGEQSGSYQYSNQFYLNSGNISCQQVGYDNTCSASVMRCSANVDSLSSGNWFFAVQAVDTSGYRSGYSLEASAFIN
ncbi:MAG: hypothetical protein Kow006_26650 [Gammaproteobacteria bacterium]